MITQAHLEKGISYKSYIQLLEELLKNGLTTGLNQSTEYLDYAKINLQRMKRLEKTVVLSPDLHHALEQVRNQYTFVIITEGWCGDASQNIAVFSAIERTFSNFKIKCLLRDENPDLMDQYLTNGSRSIPKVICISDDNLQEKFVWGPRPAALQKQVETLLKNHVSKEEKGLFVQSWYNGDKTNETQKEICALVQNL